MRKNNTNGKQLDILCHVVHIILQCKFKIFLNNTDIMKPTRRDM